MKSKVGTKVSRRRFLEATVVSAAAAKSAGAGTLVPDAVDEDRRRLEALVEEYGSELGDLRKVR